MKNSIIPFLFDVHIFEPHGASKDLIREASEAIAEIISQRPLPETVVKQLQGQILYERVHSSAVTEGNRLSKRETIVVLTTGLVEAGSRKDELEVRNLANAIIELEENLRVRNPLTGHLVRHLNKLVLSDINDNAAGGYRKGNVAISGAKSQPPPFYEVSDLIQQVLDHYATLNESIHPIQKAAWIHWAIARIHPFQDGNGRIARLLQDYVLLQCEYVPAPLQVEDREGGYYAALEAADLGDGRPFLELVTKNTIRMADRYLAIIREEETKRDWVTKIARAATEKAKQTDHRRFLSLQRSSNILKTEFFNLATALDEQTYSVDIKFRDYGSLEFEKFREIETLGKAKKTWFFGLEFRIEETVLRYIFWYGSHYSNPHDISGSLPSVVVLLVSAEEEVRYYRLLDEIEEDRVSLREIVPDQSSFWRRRYNPVQEKQEWDTNISGGAIARDFFEEVLSKLGVI